MDYSSLYQEHILDHYKNPRNKGTLENPDFSAGVFNPLCGDEVVIKGIIKDGRIQRCVFGAKGCVISQASASLVTERVIGRTVQEVLNLSKDDVLDLVKLELGPNRLRCALIALEALHNGLRESEKKE